MKATYNAQREKWDLNELIFISVQEEDRMRHEKTETMNLVHTSDGKKKSTNKGKSHNASKNSHAAKNAPSQLGSHNLKKLTRQLCSNVVFAKRVAI